MKNREFLYALVLCPVSFIAATQLRALGEACGLGIPRLLREKRLAWEILMCGDEAWQHVTSELTHEQLRSLIKGLVRFGKTSGWYGGSVSPVIALLCTQVDMLADGEPDFTSSIAANRSNDDEPFRLSSLTRAVYSRSFGTVVAPV